MGAISSIHFQISKENNATHNDRTLKPNYLLKDGGQGIEIDLNYKDALELKNKIIKDATDAYTKRTGQRLQAKKIEWSAVVNIKEDTTMSDLKKLTEHFEKKYGWQFYQIAIHRDEGHIDKETQEIKINQHAHLEFVSLNKDGINSFKKCEFGRKKMSEIQTEVSKILGMERGQENSKAQRLNHYQFREQAQQKELLNLEIKELKKENENLKEEVKKEKKKNKDIDTQTNKKKLLKKDVKKFLEEVRKSWKGQGYTKEDFRALNALNQNEYFDYESIMLDVSKITDARINEQANQIEQNTKENVLNKINEKLENIDLNNTRELSKVLVEEIDNLQEKNTVLNHELNNLIFKDEKKAFINFNKSKENELKERLRNHINVSQSKESALNKTFLMMKDTKEKTENKNAKLESENKYLKMKIQEYDDNLKDLNKVQELKEDNLELQRQKKELKIEKQNIIDEQQKEINSLKNDLIKSHDENKKLKKSLDAYKLIFEKVTDFIIDKFNISKDKLISFVQKSVKEKLNLKDFFKDKTDFNHSFTLMTIDEPKKIGDLLSIKAIDLDTRIIKFLKLDNKDGFYNDFKYTPGDCFNLKGIYENDSTIKVSSICFNNEKTQYVINEGQKILREQEQSHQNHLQEQEKVKKSRGLSR